MHFVWIVLQGIFTSKKVEQPLYFFCTFFEFLTITILFRSLEPQFQAFKGKKGQGKNAMLVVQAFSFLQALLCSKILVKHQENNKKYTIEKIIFICRNHFCISVLINQLIQGSSNHLKCGMSTLKHVYFMWSLFSTAPVKHLIQTKMKVQC